MSLSNNICHIIYCYVYNLPPYQISHTQYNIPLPSQKGTLSKYLNRSQLSNLNSVNIAPQQMLQLIHGLHELLCVQYQYLHLGMAHTSNVRVCFTLPLCPPRTS